MKIQTIQFNYNANQQGFTEITYFFCFDKIKSEKKGFEQLNENFSLLENILDKNLSNFEKKQDKGYVNQNGVSGSYLYENKDYDRTKLVFNFDKSNLKFGIDLFNYDKNSDRVLSIYDEIRNLNLKDEKRAKENMKTIDDLRSGEIQPFAYLKSEN